MNTSLIMSCIIGVTGRLINRIISGHSGLAVIFNITYLQTFRPSNWSLSRHEIKLQYKGFPNKGDMF